MADDFIVTLDNTGTNEDHKSDRANCKRKSHDPQSPQKLSQNLPIHQTTPLSISEITTPVGTKKRKISLHDRALRTLKVRLIVRRKGKLSLYPCTKTWLLFD